MKKIKVINDSDFRDALNKISVEVNELLTDEYRMLLSKYFTSQGLNDYIVEMIFDIVTRYSRSNNRDKLTRMYSENFNVNLESNNRNNNSSNNNPSPYMGDVDLDIKRP